MSTQNIPTITADSTVSVVVSNLGKADGKVSNRYPLGDRFIADVHNDQLAAHMAELGLSKTTATCSGPERWVPANGETDKFTFKLVELYKVGQLTPAGQSLVIGTGKPRGLDPKLVAKGEQPSDCYVEATRIIKSVIPATAAKKLAKFKLS